MAGKETEGIQAGDMIAGMLVVEVADKYWGWDQTAVFLVPPESERKGTASGREWVVKRKQPTDEQDRPLLCPNCYGPDPEGYPIEVLEG
jgi:hypothetical protein